MEKVIPAIKQAHNGEVSAIASRSLNKAKNAAQKLNIPSFYGSYEELLQDAEVDAVYIPLPNHLHVPKTIEALEAGKHVLCEKPIALDTEEAKMLVHKVQQYPHLKVMEAFMYRFHPQWQKVKSLVDDNEIGELRTIHTAFSYYNDDPNNIRNKPNMGGGGLMDIGCYCISVARYLFDEEPVNIDGYWRLDPEFGTDYLASGTLEFKSGTATFSCSTKSAHHQHVELLGSHGRIVIEIPFNAPPQKATNVWVSRNGNKEQLSIPPANQYTLQAESFAEAILNDKPVPTPLEDAVNNMKGIDAFRKSAKQS